MFSCPSGLRRQLSLPIESPGFRFNLFSQHCLDHIARRRDTHPHKNQEREKILKIRTGEISVLAALEHNLAARGCHAPSIVREKFSIVLASRRPSGNG